MRLKKKRQVHPTQKAFLTSDKQFRLFVGGRGAGKTYSGALAAIEEEQTKKFLAKQEKNKKADTADKVKQVADAAGGNVLKAPPQTWSGTRGPGSN